MTPVSEEDLQAYADGALDEGLRAGVEAYLAEHHDDAARVQAWRELNAALRATYNPVLDESVPERLRAVRRRSS